MNYKKAFMNQSAFLTLCIVSLASSVGVSHAENKKFSGVIRSVAPTPVIEIPNGGFVAGIQEYAFTAKAETEICSFVKLERLALNGLSNINDWRCYFEWDENLADSVVGSSNEAEGVFSEPGVYDLSYRVSVYQNHRPDSKVEVYSGTYSLTVNEPEAPKITDIKTQWTRGLKEGFIQNNYSPTALISRHEVYVEPRGYEQVVTLLEDMCTVRVGRESCVIYTRKSYGDTGENVTGTENHLVTINSKNNYFEEIAETLVVNWDYRPNEMLAFHYHTGANVAEEVDFEFNGTTYKIKKDEAIAILSNPAMNAGRTDDSWKPRNPQLILELDENVIQSNTLDIGPNRLRFNIPNLTLTGRYHVRPTSHEVQGEYLIYRYSLDRVGDGRYNVNIDLTDNNNIAALYTITDQLIDRVPPVIELLLDQQPLRFSSSLYFLSELGGAAHGGWNDGTRITGATYGGIDLPLGGELESAQFVQDEIDLGLQPGEHYDFVVKAVDGVGNEAEKSISLQYQPAKFRVDNAPETIYHRVQSLDMYLRQTTDNCTLATSKEIAQLLSVVNRKGCTYHWTNAPDSLEMVYRGWTTALVGSLNEIGATTIDWHVNYHTKAGSEMRVASGSVEITAVPHGDIDLIITDTNKLAEGVYGQRPNDGRITRYEFETVPAAVDIITSDIDGGEPHVREMNQLSLNRKYVVSGNIQDPNYRDREVFSRYPVTLTAQYRLAPDLSWSKTIDVIKLPEENVTATLSIEEGTLLSTNDISVTVNVGRVIRGEHQYSSDMGMWDVRLGLVSRSGDEVEVAQAQPIDESGRVIFEVPASELFQFNGLLYAYANIRSPHPEFSRELRSMGRQIQILKGSAVEGELGSRRVHGRTPFITNVQFSYESLEDRRVATNLRWEQSSDGINWESLEEHNNREFASFRLLEPGTVHVRAKVDNSQTGEVTTTESLELISYTVPRITISGPRQVYEGQEATYTLSVYGEQLHDSDGEAQWSVDGGETWINGTTEQTLSFSEGTSLLYTRFRYHSTAEEVGDDGWATGQLYMQVVEPRALSVTAQTPNMIEAGKVAKLTGFARNPYGQISAPIAYQWTLPNGDVVSELTYDYDVTEADVEGHTRVPFKLAAWVEGYKDETFTEVTREVSAFSYEFPASTMAVHANIAIAPSNIYASVSMPYVFAPGVEFDYEWIIDTSKARVENNNGRNILIVAEEPGVHQIRVRVSDNRGNSTTLTQFVDIVEADDMTGSMNIYPSNRFKRAPLMLSMNASASPGHPRDYAETYVWRVNGEVLNFERTTARYEITEPGQYEIEVEVISRYGQKEILKESFTAVPNEPPICSPTVEMSASFVTVRANCVDPDGLVRTYFSHFGDTVIGPHGPTLRLSREMYPTLVMTLKAIDDAGAETTTTVEW